MQARQVSAALALAFGALGAAAPATAATPSARALLAGSNANCQIRSSPFQLSYDPIAKNDTVRLSYVSVRCQAQGPLHLTVEAGPGATGGVGSRTMSSALTGAKIGYVLLLDGAPFGDGSAGTRQFVRDFASTGGFVEAAFTVRLVAPAGQDVPAGSYGDRISLVVRF